MNGERLKYGTNGVERFAKTKLLWFLVSFLRGRCEKIRSNSSDVNGWVAV